MNKKCFVEALKFPKYPMDKFVIAITGYHKKPMFYRTCKNENWTLDLNKSEIFDGNCFYTIKEKCSQMLTSAQMPKGYEWYELVEVKVEHIAKVQSVKKGKIT